jgi:ABC-type Fe3+-hydroxamate transport system substrate-binding protein
VGRLTAAALAAAVLLVATACGERSEPTGPSADLYPVTVQSPSGAGSIVLDKPAERIAVIAPSARRILIALGAYSQIAGAPYAKNGSLNGSRLRALHPDLVVASSTTDDRSLKLAARTLPHTPLYESPDDSVRGVEQTITQLGLLTGRPGEARNLVRTIEQKQALVSRRLAGKPGVSVFVDTGYFISVSNQSLIADLLREAHAHNVAGDAPQVGPFDLHELLRLQPRYYLATSDSGTTLAQLRKNHLAKQLGAVRAGRFAIVPKALLEPGPSVGAGLAELAKLLHPDAFH